MAQYYRITAYHPQEDISAIFDSNGYFEKLWQFSSFLLQKGFKILEVGDDSKFTDINIDKAESDVEHIILRASQTGKPVYSEKTVDGVTYKVVEVEGKQYILKQ